MWLMTLLLAIVFILRPLRAVFLSKPSLTLPMVAGAFLGYAFGCFLNANIPQHYPWLPAGHALAGAIVIGGAVHNWLRHQ